MGVMKHGTTITYSNEMLKDVIAKINSNPMNCISNMELLNRILASPNPPIKAAIEYGVISCILSCFQSRDLIVQYFCCWCLTNLSSGEEDALYATFQCLPNLILLLSSPDVGIQVQAAWAIGNIASGGEVGRNAVYKAGALVPLCELFVASSGLAGVTSDSFSEDRTAGHHPLAVQVTGDHQSGNGLLETLAFTLCNLAKDEPQPVLYRFIKCGIHHCLPPLLESKNENIVREVSWLVANLANKSNNYQVNSCLIKSGIINNLLANLSCGKPSIIIPSLRSLGNLAKSSLSMDMKEEIIKDDSLVVALLYCLNSSIHLIQKETLFVISNMAAIENFRSLLLNEQNGLVLIKSVINIFSCDTYSEKQKEASFAIGNFLLDTRYISILGKDVFNLFCQLLQSNDADLVLMSLIALQSLSQANLINRESLTESTVLKLNDLSKNCHNNVIRNYASIILGRL